jgi:hypothetical protein
LLASCDKHPAAPLVFSYDGGPIQPGYHVTEVKAGQFAALDCGGNPRPGRRSSFSSGTSLKATAPTCSPASSPPSSARVSEHVGLDTGARLTFEVSDGVAPMQLHCAGSPTLSAGILCVSLSARPASCKPRDRWLEEQKASACCVSVTAGSSPCCG